MKIKILIVEDEKYLSDGVAIFLRHYDFDVHQSFDGQSAIKAFENLNPDIILLDTILPDMKGIEICKKFKSQSNVGIIFLTALSGKTNIINGFNSGADDYITKPFDMDILLSRIRALLKRIKLKDEGFLSEQYQIINNLGFDMYKNDVFFKGNYANLTPLEFRILYYLASKNDFCTKSEILEFLYGTNVNKIESRTISVHISNIRKKLKSTQLNNVVITSKYKKGYRIEKNIGS